MAPRKEAMPLMACDWIVLDKAGVFPTGGRPSTRGGVTGNALEDSKALVILLFFFFVSLLPSWLSLAWHHGWIA